MFSKDGEEIIRYLSIVTDALETALVRAKSAVWRTSVTIERHRIISEPSLVRQATKPVLLPYVNVIKHTFVAMKYELGHGGAPRRRTCTQIGAPVSPINASRTVVDENFSNCATVESI